MNNNKYDESNNPESFADSLVGILKLRYENEEMFSNDKIRKTELQTLVLTKLFDVSNFPSTETREEVAILLGLPQRSVQIWFQNRRQQFRKNNQERSHYEGANLNFGNNYNFKSHPLIVDSHQIPTSQIIAVITESQIEIDNHFR